MVGGIDIAPEAAGGGAGSPSLDETGVAVGVGAMAVVLRGGMLIHIGLVCFLQLRQAVSDVKAASGARVRRLMVA